MVCANQVHLRRLVRDGPAMTERGQQQRVEGFMSTKVLAGAAAVLLLAAACTSSATPAPSTAITGTGSIPKPAGSLDVKIGSSSSIGFSHLPLHMAADTLNSQGWNIQFVDF